MNPNNQAPTVTVEQTKPLECKCGNATFTSGFLFRKIPRMLIGAKEDQLQEVKVLLCNKCGAVSEAFLAPQIIALLAKEQNTPGYPKVDTIVPQSGTIITKMLTKTTT